jgi:hypothetical protein
VLLVGVGIRVYWYHKGKINIPENGLNMVLLSAERLEEKRVADE